MLKDRLEVVANIVNNEASVLTISQKLVCEIRLLKFSTYPNCQSVVMASNNWCYSRRQFVGNDSFVDVSWKHCGNVKKWRCYKLVTTWCQSCKFVMFQVSYNIFLILRQRRHTYFFSISWKVTFLRTKETLKCVNTVKSWGLPCFAWVPYKPIWIQVLQCQIYVGATSERLKNISE